jgi:hypothetical protein
LCLMVPTTFVIRMSLSSSGAQTQLRSQTYRLKMIMP